MKIRIASSSLVLFGLMCYALPAFAISSASASSARLCPAVDCDCEFIESPKWKKLCSVREQSITQECVENGGKPKGYCGLHGPEAYPVATSIQFKNRPTLDTDISPKSMAKTVVTQTWSLNDDFKVLKEKESKGNVVEAIQIFGLFKKNSMKLFNTQQQAVLGFRATTGNKSSIAYAKDISKSVSALGQELSLYGDDLWQRTFSLKDGNRKKAYKSLAFKITREAATLFERAGELYANANQNANAASTWQDASAVAKKLLGWETETSNKAKYVAYYQRQATARLNRATVYWLKAQDLDKVAENISSVSGGFSKEEEEVLQGGGVATAID